MHVIVVSLFCSWKERYPRVLKKKSIWTRIWLSIPKFIYWKLWLETNDMIFNNIVHSPLTVVAKAKVLLLESMGNYSSKLDSSLLT